jgi:rhodanese-related sulfurtransferase
MLSREPKGYTDISPAEVALRIARGEKLHLIDVREAEEHELARIEGAQLLPLSLFDEWAGTLDSDVEIIFMCHHGMRSAHVCAALVREGFSRLRNLAGGIDRWSQEVDRTVPRY